MSLWNRIKPLDAGGWWAAVALLALGIACAIAFVGIVGMVVTR